MPYTDPATLTFATNENPLASVKLNNATNNQFLGLFPDGAANLDWDPVFLSDGGGMATTDEDGGSYRIGAIQFLWARVRVSVVGTGTYYVELPVPCVGIQTGTALGAAFVQDTTASSNNITGAVLLDSGAPQRFRFAFPGGNLGPTIPFTLATDDRISFQAQYPIA